MTMDAPIATLREKHAEANAQVTDLEASHATLLQDADHARFAIDSAKRERDSYAAAISTLENVDASVEGDEL